MEDFWKAAAGMVVTAVLALALEKQEKDMAMLLSLAACVMGAVLAISWLEPVVHLLWELGNTALLQEEWLEILLKAAGIALAAELLGGLCTDAGSGALGKTLQLLATAAILSLCVPMLRMLLALVRDILEML